MYRRPEPHNWPTPRSVLPYNGQCACFVACHKYRSHFGSRYKLGCCGHAGLFLHGSSPSLQTYLRGRKRNQFCFGENVEPCGVKVINQTDTTLRFSQTVPQTGDRERSGVIEAVQLSATVVRQAGEAAHESVSVHGALFHH